MDTSKMRGPLKGAARIFKAGLTIQDLGHPWDAPFCHHNAL